MRVNICEQSLTNEAKSEKLFLHKGGGHMLPPHNGVIFILPPKEGYTRTVTKSLTKAAKNPYFFFEIFLCYDVFCFPVMWDDL